MKTFFLYIGAEVLKFQGEAEMARGQSSVAREMQAKKEILARFLHYNLVSDYVIMPPPHQRPEQQRILFLIEQGRQHYD